MADLPITGLPSIPADQVKPGEDVLAVADVSTSNTKKITPTSVVAAALKPEAQGGIRAGSISPIKIDWTSAADDSIPGDAVDLGTITIADNSIGTTQLQNSSVTAAKLANDAVTVSKLDSSVVDPDGGLELNANGLAITNDIPAGTFAGITYDEHGSITGVDPDGIPVASLPTATETTKGVVSVPTTGGIKVSGDGEITHNNTLSSGGTFAGVVYDSHGHITSVDPTSKVPSASIPTAGTTSSEVGGVYVPGTGSLSVDSDGKLSHVANTTPGEYTKVVVDAAGHVTAGGALTPTDIPSVNAGSIIGEITNSQLADGAVTGPKIADYATCLMQESNPGRGDFLGQFWYTPSTAQLRVYSRGSGPENIWLPVGFGALQANNLRWGGTYDADTDTIVSVTAIGTSEGITAGQAYPAPSDELSGLYFVCQVAGNSMSQPNLNGISHTSGDWALCLDETQGWIHIDVNGGGGGGGGGGAQYLNDLLDVEIGGASSPFSSTASIAPTAALERDQILRYDGDSGLWRNTDIIDGGSID